MIEDSNSDNFSPNSQPQNQSNSKKYAVIDHSIRVKLLKRILSKEATIKEAAKEFGVNFSTAKAILQTYRKEGRIGKKKTRDRNKKKDYEDLKIRKVQSMCDLENSSPQYRRTFSPDLRPGERHLKNISQTLQSPSIVQQQLQQLNYLNSQSGIGSTKNLEEQSVQFALAMCQRELAKEKMINMQLLMMLQYQSYQQNQQQEPQIKVETIEK